MTQPEHKSSRTIAEKLAANKGHVHFAGVCGVGMAGLAFLLKARGFKVTGCDLSTGRMAEWLEKRGIKVFEGHASEHIDGKVDWVVRSAAVSLGSPEMVRAKKLGIPVFSRGTVLPEAIAGFTSVAVGGTHGKTTTTTFIAQLLVSAGKKPSWCIGGEPGKIGGVAGFQGSSIPVTGAKAGRKIDHDDIIVVEADESDGTLALYRPDIAVVTNIEFDHMEHFDSVAEFEGCFRKFINRAGKRAIYCLEDNRASALCRGKAQCLSYGFKAGADVRGMGVRLFSSSSKFTIERDGKRIGNINLPVPGIHNVLNALAAAAAGLELGLSFADIRKGLSGVDLPGRRFERIAEKDGVLVISDYAHHPSEIKALVRTATNLGCRRVLAVFQPHRFTRTLALGKDFPPAFDGLDEVVLVPVYAASEKPLKGGTSWDLYENFRLQISDFRLKDMECGDDKAGKTFLNSTALRRNRQSAIINRKLHVSVATSLERAWAYFRTQLRKGDLFLVVGAGDVEKIARWAREEINDKLPIVDLNNGYNRNKFSFGKLGPGTRVRFDVPLAKMTTLGVGGSADMFINTGSLKDLTAIVKWTNRNNVPFRVIGGGSNLVISDLGLRGVTARLSSGDFGGIRLEGGVVVAGAGVPLAKLLGWLEERGLAGLEFLDSIPGTVGGAVRMNAGAWGRETGTQVSWIHCLNMAGAACRVRGNLLKFEYRKCPGLQDRILVEAGFTVSKSDREEIQKRRMEIRQRREWMKGLRSAGSVFRNPKNDFAGRLIESAGLKGAKVGGAMVSKVHANVIVTEAGACGTDVMALMEKIRSEVMLRSKVCLDTEVVFLE